MYIVSGIGVTTFRSYLVVVTAVVNVFFCNLSHFSIIKEGTWIHGLLPLYFLYSYLFDERKQYFWVGLPS